jgi:hypothetical protein
MPHYGLRLLSLLVDALTSSPLFSHSQSTRINHVSAFVAVSASATRLPETYS